ncbi:MAG: spore coat U domain-containing protein [Woeseia sp.]
MTLRLSPLGAIFWIGAVLVFLAPRAHAQTATDNFQVSVTILDSCSIVADDLDFGGQTVLDSVVDDSTLVTVNCSVGTAYAVSLDAGVNGTRLMSDGSETVAYELYTSALRTLEWGINVGVDTLGGIGTGIDQVLTAYGRVLVQATPGPATYTDTITATIAF